MTHDKLLEKIEDKRELCKYAGFSKNQIAAFSALRAVVELHRPMPLIDDCYGCRQADPYLNKVWPCETIEVIEKELS